MKKEFDIIVIGGGHAGVEASLAVSRMELKVLLVTTQLSRISYMACNPSIGGLAKGNLVKEIDVLGGVMGLAGDSACLQYKQLNSKKGPAVRGSRVQCDKRMYQEYVQQYLKKQENITLLEDEISQLWVQNGKCWGVIQKDKTVIRSQAVILTTGTFMRAVMFVGEEQKSGGRIGDSATYGLSQQMADMGFQVTRLKTGTPPRLHKDSIDWNRTLPQKGDEIYRPLSFFSPKKPSLKQVLCYLTYTNSKTHEVINKNLKFSPLYSGVIQGTGPRYCPSIEDKVVRFPDKNFHQTFLEPENLEGPSIYVQGLSTSLPRWVQEQFIRTIKGLEKAQFLQWGYAVEYDFINPLQIWPTLETKILPGLFLAGQVNGSSGYEEAAVQGLIAGVNAGAKIKNLPELILQRHQAYAGVLIDDLVTKGTTEPYRMLTSRAEYRLILREDNAVERLLPIACQYELLSKEKECFFKNLLERRKKYKEKLLRLKWTSQKLNQTFSDSKNSLDKNCKDKPIQKKSESVKNRSFEENAKVKNFKTEHVCLEYEKDKPSNTRPFREGEMWTAYQLLKRPEFSYKNLEKLGVSYELQEIAEPVEIEIKYEGYISIQNQTIKKNQKMGNMNLNDVDYKQVKGLSSEAKEKLERVQPRTLAQAQRISGVTPSSIQALIVHLYKKAT